jgi:cell division ATPase FtsA
VREVFIGISGSHVQAINSTGMVTLRSGEVTHDDV